MKLVIHHGRATPMVAIGANQCKLLDFAFRYPGWHSYMRRDRATLRALSRLEEKGYVQVMSGQFRFHRVFA